MNLSTSGGRILLNVDGKQYAASYRIDNGVITVTSGAASDCVEVGEVDDPKSVARTVLKAMVTQGRAVLAPIQVMGVLGNASVKSGRGRESFFVFPRSSPRRHRTHN